jgi:hypothetical protein
VSGETEEIPMTDKRSKRFRRERAGRWLREKYGKLDQFYDWEEIEPEDADFWMSQGDELLALLSDQEPVGWEPIDTYDSERDGYVLVESDGAIRTAALFARGWEMDMGVPLTFEPEHWTPIPALTTQEPDNG